MSMPAEPTPKPPAQGQPQPEPQPQREPGQPEQGDKPERETTKEQSQPGSERETTKEQSQPGSEQERPKARESQPGPAAEKDGDSEAEESRKDDEPSLRERVRAATEYVRQQQEREREERNARERDREEEESRQDSGSQESQGQEQPEFLDLVFGGDGGDTGRDDASDTPMPTENEDMDADSDGDDRDDPFSGIRDSLGSGLLGMNGNGEASSDHSESERTRGDNPETRSPVRRRRRAAREYEQGEPELYKAAQDLGRRGGQVSASLRRARAKAPRSAPIQPGARR